MTEYRFTSIRLVDGRLRKVIVDLYGDIINRNPTKEELKCLRHELSKKEIVNNKDVLLEFLIHFNEKEGRPPKEEDFNNDPKYPSDSTIAKAFGSWNRAIELTGLEVKTKYKIPVKMNGNKFWVVYDNGKFIRNPTEEDLKGTELKTYNTANVCHLCEEENKREGKGLTDKSILYPNNVLRETDKDGKKTDKWVCYIHGMRSYSRYDPNSESNIIKLMRDRRTGNLKDARQILADNCQECTCKWLGCEDLNKKNDNYNSPIDCSPIPKGVSVMIGGKLVDLSGKIPQVKGATYSSRYGGWGQSSKTTEHSKKFDIVILYCVSENGEKIERIYFIPKGDIIKISSIGIYKNPTDRWGNHIISKYEQYRVEDEKVLEYVNKIWKDIKSRNKKEKK